VELRAALALPPYNPRDSPADTPGSALGAIHKFGLLPTSYCILQACVAYKILA